MVQTEMNPSNQFSKNSTLGSGSTFKLVDYNGTCPGLFGLHFDLKGEKVNKLSASVLEELRAVLLGLQTRTDIKALVFISDKEGIFIAGADITAIMTIKEKKEGERLAREGQAILELFETLKFPTIAAIHGASMGGGTEAAMCCKYIIVSDSPGTKIGLPEVNLGILPGFGGTYRMPKRIGLQPAMDFILTGKTMNGDKAVKLGFADAVLPFQNFREKALEFGAKVIRGQFKKAPKKESAMQGLMSFALEKNPVGRTVLFSQARKMILSKTHGHYPAPLKILDVLSASAGKSKKSALLIEQKGFGELVVTDVSKRLIDLFFATEKVKKQTGVEGKKLEPKDQVKQLGVLGAGVMGGGIAQLSAAKLIPVRMKDIDHKGLALGMSSALKIFSGLVKRKSLTKKQMEQRLELISSTTEYTGFHRLDAVIEAVVEIMDVKKKVLAEVEAVSSENLIFATNTSSLSVNELAKGAKHPENVVGMHFFNPVHKMPLIEVIRGEKTNDRAVLAIFDLSKRLGKTPIVVKDGAGFLVNRLLMPYLNEAGYLMAEGAPIEELDKAVLDFGMPMGPATLLDEIGIDTGAKVAIILEKAFGERMAPCPTNDKLVKAKLYGKKTSKGFYLYDSALKKTGLNPEIYTVLGVKPVSPTKDQKQNWIPRMIYTMINEAALCLEEGIVAHPQDVDLGMIMGTGFPPFRGGLLRYADAVGVQNIVKSLEQLSKVVSPRFTPSKAILKMASENRKFYQD